MPLCLPLKEQYQRLIHIQHEFSTSLTKGDFTTANVKRIEVALLLTTLKEQFILPELQHLAGYTEASRNWILAGTPAPLPSDPSFFQSLVATRERGGITQYHNTEALFLNYEQLFAEGREVLFDPNTDSHYLAWLNGQLNTVAVTLDYLHSEEFTQRFTKTYGAPPILPTIAVEEYLSKNPTNIPTTLKGGTWYYYPGSVAREGGGRWSAPCGNWDGAGGDRSGDWVENGWGDGERVLLFRGSL